MFCRIFALLLGCSLCAVVSHNAWGDVGGRIEIEGQSYLGDLPDPTRTEDLLTRLGLNASFKTKNIKAAFELMARSQVLSEVSSEQGFFQAKQAHLSFKSYPLNLTLGLNTHNWGLFDVYSPMDVINPRAYFDLLGPDKLSSPGLDIKFESSEFTLQVLYIPRQFEPLMPPEDSRWLPRKILLDTSVEGLRFRLPLEFNYVYGPSIRFDKALDHNFGFRLSRRASQFDLALLFFEGVATTPQFAIDASGTLSSTEEQTIDIDSDIRLQALFYKTQTSGLQLSYVSGSYIFKLESVYTHSLGEANAYQDWSFQNVLGLEKSLNIFGLSSNFIGQIYLGDSDDVKGNLLSSSARLFDQSLALALRMGFSSTSSVTLGGLYDMTNQGALLRLNFHGKLIESIEFDFNFEYLTGDENSLLGSYKDNTRLRLGLISRF